MPKSKNRRHRLSSYEIYEVKKLLTDGRWTQEEIATRIKATQGTISAIKNGRIGAHVPWPAVEYEGKFIPTMELGMDEAERIRAKGDLESNPWLALSEEQWTSRKQGINRWRVESNLPVLDEVGNDNEFWENHLTIWSLAQQVVRHKDDDSLEDELVFTPPTEDDLAQLAKDRDDYSKPSGPASYTKMPLATIARLGKGRRVIDLALGEGSSPALREAVQIVCNFHKDPDCWRDEFFVKQVREMEVRLRQWPEAMVRIANEQNIGSEIIKPAILNEGDELPPRKQAAIDREIESEFREVGELPALEDRGILRDDLKKDIEEG